MLVVYAAGKHPQSTRSWTRSMNEPDPNERPDAPARSTEKGPGGTRLTTRVNRRTLLATASVVVAAGITTQTGSAQSTATGPTVYVGSRDGTLYAVDTVTGNQQWAFESSDGVFSSPTVVDGTVYVGSNDETLYAVDADTGEQEWAFTQPSGLVRSSPTVVGGTVYVGSNDETLYAVDADTGEQEWAFTQPSGAVFSSPTVVGGTVYVGSNDETLYAVNVTTGEQEWAFTEPSVAVRSSPTVVADPNNDGSIGSRVNLGTLGHHGGWSGEHVPVGSDVEEGAEGDGEEEAEGAEGDGQEEAEGAEGDGEQKEEDEVIFVIPGFGIGSTLTALGGAGYMLKRRLESDNLD